jgi:hypothetical protein
MRLSARTSVAATLWRASRTLKDYPPNYVDDRLADLEPAYSRRRVIGRVVT